MREESNLRIIYDKPTKLQDIRLYLDDDDNLLFTLDKFAQFKEGEDEQNYHKALVDDAIELHPNPKSFLILGGGDGLCARNIINKITNPQITLVDFDKELVEFCRTDFRIVKINEGALDKCKLIYQDALQWVIINDQRFDIIILDFPDETNEKLSPLYKEPFYSNVISHLNVDGVISIQINPDRAEKVHKIIKKLLKNSKINIFSKP